MCQPYNDNPSEQNAAVVCRELGYEEAVTTSRRPKDTTIHSHVLWHDLYCSTDEESIFDCDKCCSPFYERYSCTNVPEYTCQSKSGYELHNY